MRRTALAAAFLAWLYGVPFLLVVGLIRRTGGPAFASPAAADRYAAVTDRYLTAAVVLNVAVPIAGLVAARLLGDRFWARHFAGALAAMLVVLMLFAAVMHRASADRGPAPQVTQCIPRSGGHGCPGG